MSYKLTLILLPEFKVLAEALLKYTSDWYLVSKKQSVFPIESIKVTLFAHDKTPEVLSGSNTFEALVQASPFMLNKLYLMKPVLVLSSYLMVILTVNL